MSENIENIARCFIVKNGEVLLCKGKGRPNYFFPGGHIKMGENAEEALKRELREEIGAELNNIYFWGICENTFSDSKGEHQEINLVFEAKIDKKESTVLEDHMEFGWFPIKDISEMNVLPESLKHQFLKWVEDKKVFYIK